MPEAECLLENLLARCGIAKDTLDEEGLTYARFALHLSLLGFGADPESSLMRALMSQDKILPSGITPERPDFAEPEGLSKTFG